MIRPETREPAAPTPNHPTYPPWIWARIHYRSDVVAGFELARKVAGAVIERARVDGSR